MEAKRKELLANSIYFFIGNIGSRFFVFLLVPIYTQHLSQSTYGTADLLTNMINLVVPILTLSINEGVFRFVMGNYDASQLLQIGSMTTLISAAISAVGGFLFGLINNDWTLAIIISAYMAVLGFRNLLTFYVKGRGKNRVYVIDSIFYTALLFIFSVFLIVWCGEGIEGYFKAFLAASISSVLFLLCFTYRDFRIQRLDFVLWREVIRYSVPLTFNTVALWIASFSDRVMLRFFIGSASTGIYAAASKLPSVFTTVLSVFLQAWMISAIRDFEAEKDDKFYSQIFGAFSTVCMLGCSVAILLSKFAMRYYVGEEFQGAANYVPLLLMNSVISGFVGFYGAIYSAARKNKGVALTTIYTAILNVVLNAVFIPLWSIFGAVLATVLSHMFFWLYRAHDTKKLFSFVVDTKRIAIGMAVLTAESLSIFIGEPLFVLVGILGTLLLCAVNRSYFSLLSPRNILTMFRRNISDD